MTCSFRGSIPGPGSRTWSATGQSSTCCRRSSRTMTPGRCCSRRMPSRVSTPPRWRDSYRASNLPGHDRTRPRHFGCAGWRTSRCDATRRTPGTRPVTGPTDRHPPAALGTGIAHAADPGLPVVGHVMRAYLARTETFVYNQMASLRRHHPVPVAHHRRPSTDFPLGDGAIAEELLRPRLAGVERLAYARLRIALPPATAALARFLREREARLLHF